MILRRLSLSFSLVLCLLLSAASQANPINTGNLDARLMSVASQIAPGSTFTLLLEHQIRPDWHTYWINPGDSGAATRLTWRGPEGFMFGDIAWPYPERIPYGPLMNYGYHDRVVYPIQVTAPANLSGDSVTFDVRGEWLVCADVCIPERGELKLTVAVGPELIIDPQMAEAEIAARQRVPQLVSIPTSVEAGSDTVTLSIAMPGLDPDRVQSVVYYPFVEALIDNPAEQLLTISATGIELILTPGYDYSESASFDGIVVIEEEAGETRTTAFEIRPLNGSGVPANSGSSGLTLTTALMFAFIGGLILNLMPCVFPVLSIKILSLMGETTHLTRHGWMYAFGVVLSFVAIAGLLIALRAGGAEIGWGFQLQSPWVVGLLVYLFLLVGLNLSGYFEIGTSLMSFGGSSLTQNGYSGSFFTGVLATLVAAPCTAPFMASAIGFALTQSNVAALLIFASLGFGMAVPYLALCYSPALLKKLPKPGAWMERFKEILAFPLYASAVWLLWVLSLQAGASGVLTIGAGAVTLTFAIWLLKHLPRGAIAKMSMQALAVVMILAVIYSPAQLQTLAASPVAEGQAAADAGQNYETYSAEKLKQYRSEGAVFVNFTAAWCVTCKVNEAVALSTPAVIEAFAQNDIRYLKGDWTNEDPEISRKLAEHGRSGVPLYLFYPAGSDSATVLPQLLTRDIVLKALQTL
ncbi:MAG: thiol:disulfide interchange protein DsbD [Candidatus Azotimanducaceae bacterium]|jgi:thiol:disulfide interchange protein/DsbC/DsbD-like thiol-disulfide interchange protein